MEYLDPPGARAPSRPQPEISIRGIDPQVPGHTVTPRVELVVAGARTRPDSVEELLLVADHGDVSVCRLTFDVRPFSDVLECRGGWNVLAQLVRGPSDRVTNAVFRASIAEEPPDRALPVLEVGDVDCDITIVGDGDGVAGRCRHELGRARLSLTPFLADSERLTRRLAQSLARPRDRATRRCLEHALSELVADVPLAALIGLHRSAPHCAVPGAWTAPVPRAEQPPRVGAPV